VSGYKIQDSWIQDDSILDFGMRILD